jgi:predicted membrane protein
MAAVSLPLFGETQTLPALSVLAAFKPMKVMLWQRVALVPNASGVPVAATVLIIDPNVCCAIVLN